MCPAGSSGLEEVCPTTSRYPRNYQTIPLTLFIYTARTRFYLDFASMIHLFVHFLNWLWIGIAVTSKIATAREADF